jgi:hypothetical protein
MTEFLKTDNVLASWVQDFLNFISKRATVHLVKYIFNCEILAIIYLRLLAWGFAIGRQSTPVSWDPQPHGLFWATKRGCAWIFASQPTQNILAGLPPTNHHH